MHMPTTFAQPSPRRHEPIVNRLEIGAICAYSLIPNRRFLEPINPAIDKLGRLGAYRALLPPEAELDAQGLGSSFRSAGCALVEGLPSVID